MALHQLQPPKISCISLGFCHVCERSAPLLRTVRPASFEFALCRYCVQSLNSALAYLEPDPPGDEE